MYSKLASAAIFRDFPLCTLGSSCTHAQYHVGSMAAPLCAFLDDSSIALAEGSKVRVWDTQRKTVKHEMSVAGVVTCLSFAPCEENGSLLAAGSSVGAVVLQDHVRGERYATLVSLAWAVVEGTAVLARSVFKIISVRLKGEDCSFGTFRTFSQQVLCIIHTGAHLQLLHSMWTLDVSTTRCC